MATVEKNLVDLAWGADQPKYSDAPIEPFDVKYAGEY